MLLKQPSAPGYRFLTRLRQRRRLHVRGPAFSGDVKANPQALTLSARIWYEVKVVPVSFSFVQQQSSHFCGFPPLVLA
jgi:hypothetical protein